jgi:hypothetical protein
MPTATPTADHAQRLQVFNQHLLEQALALAAAHAGPGRPRYAGLVGAHLRHVIEHYEALLFPAQAGIVDYDARARDAQLEASPQLARTRLLALHHALGSCAAAQLHDAVQVRGQGGLAGEFDFQVPSSLGRELAFVASHTVHHFALLAGHCQQHGIATPEGFGKAPATRAHERAGHVLACA